MKNQTGQSRALEEADRGFVMGKRESFEKIFIAVVAFAFVSLFLPCFEQLTVQNGVTKSTTLTILDAQTYLAPVILLILVPVTIVIGKVIAPSVIGIIEAIMNAVIIWSYVDSAQYKMKLLEDPDKAFAALMRYQGVTAVSYRYPVGFYIAAASIALLFIVSVIGFFIPKDSDKVLL